MTRKLQLHSIEFAIILSILIVLLISGGIARAQQSTGGTATLAQTPGAPAGSYALSDFDSVNLFNGNLNFSLPLYTSGGRGRTNYTIPLKIERRWTTQTRAITFPEPGVEWYTTEFIRNGIHPGYSPGVMQIYQSGYGDHPCYIYGDPNPPHYYDQTMTKLIFTATDGTEYEFLGNLGNGVGGTALIYGCDFTPTGFNRGNVFKSIDGSAMTFISDQTIYDQKIVGSIDPSFPGTVDGYLLFKDGTRYRIEYGMVKWMRDPNGNLTTFSYNSPYPGGVLQTITDSIGRRVDIESATSECGGYDQFTYQGFDRNNPRKVKVGYTCLGNALRMTRPSDPQVPGASTYEQLFPSSTHDPTELYNPRVVSYFELPDQLRRYQFYYNVYGELARVELPTGGAIEYEHGAGWVNPEHPSGLWLGWGYGNEYGWHIYRRIWERRVYVNKTDPEPESRTIYGIPVDPTGQGSSTSIEVKQFGGSSPTPLAVQRHQFLGNAAPSYSPPGQWYVPPDLMSGREETTESLTWSGTLLRRVAHEWRLGEVVGKGPYIAKTVTTLADSNPDLVSKQTFTYDNYNNLTDTFQYAFGNDQPSDLLLRHTHTSYLTVNPAQHGVSYVSGTSATSVHIRNLPAEQWVSTDMTGDNKLSRTTFEYDNYNTDAYHAALVNRENISGLCTAFTANSTPPNSNGQCSNTILPPVNYRTRGNATASIRWISSDTALSTYSQYDIVGNVVKAFDAEGHMTDISYADNFNRDEPDGDVQPGFQPAELGSQQSYAFPTRITNALGHTSYNQYDYYLGAVVDAKDANGVITTSYFADELDRPSRVILANNIPSLRQQKSINYDDPNVTVTVTSDLRTYNDNLLKSETLYDGLGRSVESRTYDSVNDYIAIKQIPFDVQRDATANRGKAVSKISNPHRPQQGQQPLWTSTTKDSLGRVVSVKTPDGALTRTEHDAARLLVTDQTGKRRLSRTNALGQLTDVWEITSTDSAAETVAFPGYSDLKGYRTSYTYDALSNLRKVEQGPQRRYFYYDSLSRLLYARNPEQGVIPNLNVPSDALSDHNNQWSLAYSYHPNDSLWKTTDARNVTTTYMHDALDRNTSVTYSDGTPSITRRYDSATNGLGKFWQSETSGAAGTRTTIGSYDALGRPLVQQQQFQAGGNWGTNYKTLRTYGLAGQVASQTYPSGHLITYARDEVGRLKEFKGNLGDGVPREYASALSYDESGRMREEKYGTLTPLYHKLKYNMRDQIYDIRLSTKSSQQDPTDWDRGCLAFSYSVQNPNWGESGTDNNGNLRKADTYVPIANGGYYQAVEVYTYDDLNRLDFVTEFPFLNGQALPGFTQDYEYDRYGNRKLKETTTTAGINRQQFEVEMATNRLMAPGDLSQSMNQRRMRHDASGNLTYDIYTGLGSRTYDAHNRMIAAADNSQQISSYTYDADGRRVRRNAGSQGEVWQVYGMDGELLAEYSANVSPFVPRKEYGYRSGELLVTAANGDEQRLTRFIQQLYRGSLGRDASSVEVQHWFGWMAGQAEEGPTALLAGAKMMAASLLDSAEAYNRNRTDRQFVQDLYWTYFERSASQSEEDMWAGRLGAGSPNPITRIALRDICANWGEFTTQVTALWGSNTAGENERTEHFLWNVYLGAHGAVPSSAQLQPQIEALDAASAQDEAAVVSKAGEIVTAFIQSPAYANRNRTNREYVADLYQVFYQRVPDQAGWDHWTNQTAVRGREYVLARFVSATAFKDVASRLYREILWLIPDHLGTPRMVAERTGRLAGIKRHDYLPFGEELFAGTAGRATAQGYVSDSVRQQFTKYERDDETGLDYAQARYYSSTQGRFTSIDPYNLVLEVQATAEIDADKAQAKFIGYLEHPQQWNRYAYVGNNPLRYVDPSGEDLELTGSEQERAAAFERLKQMVGPEAAKYLYVTATQDRNGNYHYFVQVDTNRVSDPLASYGGQLGVFISDIINTTNIVEFRVATQFSTKYSTDVKTAGGDCGGGCTVGREESLTGNTQIFVHPDAGNVAQMAFNTATNQAYKVNPAGQLDFYNDIVDAHEFGHAHANAIEGIPLGKGQTGSFPRSLQLENYVRERRGLSRRRTGH